MNLRSALLVARFDLMDSIRSRKALALLVLYATGALAGTAIFIRVLEAIEEALAETLRVAQTSQVGTMTSALFETAEFRRVVGSLVGDQALGAQLVRLPPLALFYGAFAFALIPLLAIVGSSDSVASEVATGQIRYSLFRTDRLSFVVGKYLGQAGLMLLGLLTGALASFGLGWLTFASFEAGPTLYWMLSISARVFVLGLAYLGAALAVSQWTRSVNVARALGIFAWFSLMSADGFLKFALRKGWDPVWVETARTFLPEAHRIDLWQPAWAPRLAATGMLVAMSIVWVSLGYLRFSREDG